MKKKMTQRKMKNKEITKEDEDVEVEEKERVKT